MHKRKMAVACRWRFSLERRGQPLELGRDWGSVCACSPGCARPLGRVVARIFQRTARTNIFDAAAMTRFACVVWPALLILRWSASMSAHSISTTFVRPKAGRM